MKSEQANRYLDEADISNSIEDIKQFHGTCCSKNQASHVCCSKRCQKDFFICNKHSCMCNKNHSKCPKLQIKGICSTISSRIIDFNDIEEKFTKKIDQMIDYLSDFKDKFIQQISKNRESFGIPRKDMKFMQILQGKSTDKVTSKSIFQMFVSLQNDESEQNQLKNMFSEQIYESQDKLQKQMNKFAEQVLRSFDILKNFDGFVGPKLFIESKVIKQREHVKRMVKFFDQEKVKSSKLLYRASEHNFQANKFWQKCKDVPNTIAVCQTQFGKIIGGFTPLVWTISSNGQCVNDETGRSFIFSLTNNHRFSLQKGKTAIYRAINIGPTFGNGDPDFYINNNAKAYESYSKINQSYVNQNYTHGSGQSYQKFNGDINKRHQFKIKEWQVWQIEFKV